MSCHRRPPVPPSKGVSPVEVPKPTIKGKPVSMPTVTKENGVPLKEGQFLQRKMDESVHSLTHTDHGIHSGHDPTLHLHHMEGDSNNGSMHCGMSMEFHFGFTETILFSTWKISSVGGLIGSMVGIILMAALYEGLKYYREYLFWKTYNSLQYKSVRFPADKVTESSSDGNKIVHLVGEVIHKQPPSIWNLMHMYQTFLHAVQMVLSYFLMLIFMTYNVWLCIAVVIGAVIGYFLFGWKKSVVVDVTEHCH